MVDSRVSSQVNLAYSVCGNCTRSPLLLKVSDLDSRRYSLLRTGVVLRYAPQRKWNVELQKSVGEADGDFGQTAAHAIIPLGPGAVSCRQHGCPSSRLTRRPQELADRDAVRVWCPRLHHVDVCDGCLCQLREQRKC